MTTYSSRLVCNESQDFKSCLWQDCVNPDFGAALFLGGEATTYTVAGSTFARNIQNNATQGYSLGGGIYVTWNATATISNVNFLGNTSGHSGGAAYNAGTMIFENALFSANQVSGGDGIGGESGGSALFNADTATVSIYGSTVEGSTGGAALYLGGFATITDSLIQNNKGTNFQCGIYVHGGTVQITGSTFSNNLIETDNVNKGYGGAAIHNCGNMSISGSTFTNNGTKGGTGKGGAIVNHSDSDTMLEISDCVFDGNYVKNSGGNPIPSSGGAIRNTSGNVTVYGSITLNTATDNIVNEEGDNGENPSLYIGKAGYNTSITGNGQIINKINTLKIQGKNVSIGTELTSTQIDLLADKIIINKATTVDGWIQWNFSEKNNQAITLVNYEKLTAGSRWLIVNGTTAPSFLVATGATYSHGGELFYLRTETNNQIYVNGSPVENYVLDQYGDKIYLTNTEKLAFGNNDWSGEQTATYHGRSYSGNVDDGQFFASFAGAREAGKTLFVAVDKGGTAAITGIVELKGNAMTLAAADTGGTYDNAVLGGERIVSSDPQVGDTHMTIEGGTFNNIVAGGSYVGGTHSEHAATQDGTCNLTIHGGTFNKSVSGGMYVYNRDDHSNKGGLNAGAAGTAVNLTIDGGTFNSRIFGGNYAKNDNVTSTESSIFGDICITIDTSLNDVCINGGLDIGCRGQGMVNGSATVTFTGSGEHLKFTGSDNRINGASSMAVREFKGGKLVPNYFITGDRRIAFDGFTGNFDGEVTLFKTLTVSGSTVNFTACDELADDTKFSTIENWQFLDDSSTLEGLSVLDFTDDTLELASTANQTLFTGTFDGIKDVKGWFKEIRVGELIYERYNYTKISATYKYGDSELGLLIIGDKLTVVTPTLA